MEKLSIPIAPPPPYSCEWLGPYIVEVNKCAEVFPQVLSL